MRWNQCVRHTWYVVMLSSGYGRADGSLSVYSPRSPQAYRTSLVDHTGMQLFDPTKREKAEYFSSLSDGLWTLLHVMNASNWPDPFLASYDVSLIVSSICAFAGACLLNLRLLYTPKCVRLMTRLSFCRRSHSILSFFIYPFLSLHPGGCST